MRYSIHPKTKNPELKVFPFLAEEQFLKLLTIVGSIFLVAIFVGFPRRAGDILISISSTLFSLFQETLPTPIYTASAAS